MSGLIEAECTVLWKFSAAFNHALVCATCAINGHSKADCFVEK